MAQESLALGPLKSGWGFRGMEKVLAPTGDHICKINNLPDWWPNVGWPYQSQSGTASSISKRWYFYGLPLGEIVREGV